MPFDWPTTDQMIYRITRLRRLVLLAVAIPVCVMLVGSLLDPAFLSPPRATLAAMAVAALVTGHVVLFPNASLETISLSVAVTVLAVSAPWVRIIAQMAPAEHVDAALIILVGLSVLATGVLMTAVHAIVGALTYAGPAVQRRITATVDLPCSVGVARGQFALQPDTRRGRVLTGAADDNGFFDVAVASPQVADPDDASKPFVVHVTAKVMQQTDQDHQVMLVLGNGSVTVTSERFEPTATGCRVEISEMPGDFTLGMHLLFWLADQQVDNLMETADVITGTDTRVNGLAHGVSFISIAGAVLSPRRPLPDRAK